LCPVPSTVEPERYTHTHTKNTPFVPFPLFEKKKKIKRVYKKQETNKARRKLVYQLSLLMKTILAMIGGIL